MIINFSRRPLKGCTGRMVHMYQKVQRAYKGIARGRFMV